MIVSVHQPHFLPWMGYFNKVLHSDVFAWLHSVQYRKNYFQNRTQIRNESNEQPLWLTLPVHARLGMAIDEVMIADPNWQEQICKTVEQCYRKAPYFIDYWPALCNSMMQASDSLDDVNYRTFLTLLDILECGHVRVVRVEDVPMSSTDATGRLVEICTYLDARYYISGKGGQTYLQTDQFESADIGVIWQNFDPNRVVYPQLGNTFVPGLSIIDCLFNVGPEQARELARQAWTPEL